GSMVLVTPSQSVKTVRSLRPNRTPCRAHDLARRSAPDRTPALCLPLVGGHSPDHRLFSPAEWCRALLLKNSAADDVLLPGASRAGTRGAVAPSLTAHGTRRRSPAYTKLGVE